MEQPTLYHCHGCKNKKPQDQFNLRQKSDKFGLKGEPTGRCTSCTIKNKQARQNLKRKHNEEDFHTSQSSERRDSAISIEQFTALLRQQAPMGDLRFQAHVSTQGLVEDEEDMFKRIVKCVWDATGFRFTFVWFPLWLQ
jgi:hypothetical protein